MTFGCLFNAVTSHSVAQFVHQVAVDAHALGRRGSDEPLANHNGTIVARGRVAGHGIEPFIVAVGG